MKHIDQGNKQLDEESFEAALKSFDLHLKEQGENSLAYLGKALAFRKMGKYPESYIEFDLALKLSPENPEFISEKAVTYFQEKKIEEAISLFDKARKLDPDNPYRHSSLAFAQAKAGFMYEAIEHYEKALELDPDDAIAHNNLGLLKDNIGYAQNAQVHFKKSDDLIGRKPSKLPKTETNSSEKETIQNQDTSSKKDESESNFLNVLKGLFQSSDERKKFIVFLKSFFSPSQDR